MWVLIYFVILNFEPLAWKQPVAFSTEVECVDYIKQYKDIADHVEHIQAFCLYQKDLGSDI